MENNKAVEVLRDKIEVEKKNIIAFRKELLQSDNALANTINECALERTKHRIEILYELVGEINGK